MADSAKRKAPAETEWEACQKTGQRLMAQLNKLLAYENKMIGRDVGEFWKSFYHTEEVAGDFGELPKCYGRNMELKEDMRSLANMDPDSLIGYETFPLDAADYNANTHIAYNFFEIEKGVIVCGHNDKSRDKPNRFEGVEMSLASSEIIFRQWKQACEDNQGTMTDLRRIWRINIVNPLSLRVLEARSPRSSGMQTYSATSPENSASRITFEALLGTPNGKGIAYMLLDHPEIFPDWTIKSVTAHWCEGHPQLMFESKHSVSLLVLTMADVLGSLRMPPPPPKFT